MSLVPLQLPPGLYCAGTEYQGKGRWKDCNLVRFYQGTIQPLGGWRTKSTSTITGKGRAVTTWIINDATATWAAVGTESHLYAMSRSGVLSDITPSGFTAGRADAVAGGGFGGGLYGKGLYGAVGLDTGIVLEASMWTLDTFGQYLVGCMAEDGFIYQWTLATGTPAAKVANAPTATAIFTTTEGMLVALGAAGIARRVQWSDQQNNTVWTASPTNQAGDLDLKTDGHLLLGLRTTSTHILLTDVDVWTMTFTPTNSIYSIVNKGNGCGGVSRKCAASIGETAVWMGLNGFWSFNGFVTPQECDVWDAVFGNINRQQMSKVTVELNTAFNEVTWHYPSAGSIENDKSVTWNYFENHWRVGYVARLSGCDRGVFQYPLAVATDGNVYEHEVGFMYGGALPYLESGPTEVLDGNNVMDVNKLLPDEATTGQVSVTFFCKFTPDGAETSFGPYSLSGYTDARFPARQVRLRYDGVAAASWRVGIPRIDVTLAGGR